jgi:small subunit ribosomal protein S21
LEERVMLVGTFREMKRRRAYEKPWERRAREKDEAIRRHRKALRKRTEREGADPLCRLTLNSGRIVHE